MDSSAYVERLYPLQDRVSAVLRGLDTGLYLTGGTAASRVYLHHRYSDDLDLFADDDPMFPVWTSRVIEAIRHVAMWDTNVSSQGERFMRLFVTEQDVTLKIECVNDLPARIGTVQQHPVFGRIDTAENILANKVTAVLDRGAPKDFADIWGFCCRMSLDLRVAITGAQGKAAGVFPADLARVLASVTEDDWRYVNWIQAPDMTRYLHDMKRLAESLLFPDGV